MKLQEWLNRPYPLIQKKKDKLILILAFGVFTYFFLLLYKPFGAAEIRENRSWFLMGFGLSVSLALTITYGVLPGIFKKIFNPGSWKIKNEVVFLLLNFVLISFFNFTYNSTVGSRIAPQHNFPEFMGITLAVGIFPLIIMIFLIELFLSRKNSAQAQMLTKKMNGSAPPLLNGIIRITPETTKSDMLELDLADFLFAVSDNNYTTVFYLKKNKLENQLLRLSLKNLEYQLKAFNTMIRCHRSYIVNKSRIKKFSGNARSLNLELEGYDKPIPVSRSFPKENLQ